ncbi:hypothetical protein GCM10025864_17190 [Luteimicrobium album]|uniref:Uncharacterized protein n=1 Tax=Luteimicrobium album TaxID=1054550 RepID=A0ABQ6HZV9_9MICO|nr:hypothetical protein GCM10025864_17190 [Luteimicrobium album]
MQQDVVLVRVADGVDLEERGPGPQRHVDVPDVQRLRTTDTARAQHPDVEGAQGRGGLGVGLLTDLPSRTKSALGSRTSIGSRVPTSSRSRTTPSAYVLPEPLCPHQNVCRLNREARSVALLPPAVSARVPMVMSPVMLAT